MDSYLSYLRTMFGFSHRQSTQAPSQRPTHSRSGSGDIPARVYAPSHAAPRPSTAPSKRADTYTSSRANRPSPLRYPTYDSADSYAHARIPVDPRPSAQRRGSYRSGEPAVHYPYFAGSARSGSTRSGYSTPASSRSNSSSSLHPGFPLSAAPVPKPSKCVRYANGRPALKQNHTWHPTSNAGSAPSYAPINVQGQVRCPPLNMHPLLAHTRFHHAPISYDVSYTPSARTVVDRTTRQPVPTHTLTQPATEPPISPSSQLILTSDKFPWTVVVGAATAYPSKMSGSRSRPPSPGAISNLDVLYALHAALLTRVSTQEWDSLGRGSRAQRRVTRAYEKRCGRMGGGWDGGVRRIDWLGGKTRLIGIEIDRNRGGAFGKLVFDKA